MTIASASLLTLAACSGASNLFDSSNTSQLFSKPIDVFAKPDWAKSSTLKTTALSPTAPVGPEDLVNADGSCAPSSAETAEVAAAPPPAANQPPVSDRLQTEGGGLVPASGGTVLGGVALGMTECQVVRRAGGPSHVAVAADEKGERKVVITYTSGGWPGVYTFTSGRLKVVDMLPEQQKPKPPARRPAPRRS